MKLVPHVEERESSFAATDVRTPSTTPAWNHHWTPIKKSMANGSVPVA